MGLFDTRAPPPPPPLSASASGIIKSFLAGKILKCRSFNLFHNTLNYFSLAALILTWMNFTRPSLIKTTTLHFIVFSFFITKQLGGPYAAVHANWFVLTRI